MNVSPRLQRTGEQEKEEEKNIGVSIESVYWLFRYREKKRFLQKWVQSQHRLISIYPKKIEKKKNER